MHILLGSCPIPLVTTECGTLYANFFVSDDHTEAIFSVYNCEGGAYNGSILRHALGRVSEVSVILGGGAVYERDGMLYGEIDADEVVYIKIYSRNL